MLCVCVGDVMDVVFSVCIVRRGAACVLFTSSMISLTPVCFTLST